jgi:hypothetical protein
VGLAPAPLLEPGPVTVPLPGQWTFWADMLADATPLGPVDVSGFGFTSRLSGFGNGSGTFALPCGLLPERLLRLWSWRLWCFYDGQPVWCGVPSGLADENGTAQVPLTFTELTGYLAKRQFDVHPKAAWTGIEQTEIARRLAEPLGEVGVRIVTDPGPGYPRDRTYEYLEGESRAQLLSNLSGVLGGPEFRAEYGMEAGRPACVLRIGYPRVGSAEGGLGVTIPGAALGYRASWDADRMRTMTFAVGDLPEDAEEGTPRPVATENRPQPDLPRLDAVDDWPGTILVETLRERARTMATVQAQPALTLSGSPPEQFPPITAYRVGDDVTLRATTPLLPAGLEVTGRLLQLDVSAAAGTATWTIGVEMPPPQARETLARRLDRLDRTLGQVFRSGPMNPQPAGEVS